ncbi:hypothetical protein MAR_011097 [Mya arenaria]|uniref:Uncharacterized protein n=1 Tax=Mya arenaria TaxID=6604 RepID=A0ABY7FT44_MYAAR|nr:hypothetical protein MAR_011097 [Mya arenaria]
MKAKEDGKLNMVFSIDSTTAAVEPYLINYHFQSFDFHEHTIGNGAAKELRNALKESKRVQDHMRQCIDLHLLKYELGVVAVYQIAGKCTFPRYLADNDKLIGKRNA